MSTTRTHFTFRVDTWTPEGESIVEHVAGIEDYQVALVTYRAACQRWPGIDPPPLKWSDLRYVLDIKEDCNGKEAIQA